MDSLEEQYGYDVTFVSEVPDYLKCIVCQLVLRKPIQIMRCGHKFCEPCFNRIKSYSENSNTQLLCPVDRELVDLNKVFEDNGINRVIGDLTVKCVNNVTGCTWTGDLRNLKGHEEQCKHKIVQELSVRPSVQEVEGTSILLKELCQRMLNCEGSLVEKEKDIAHLKFNLQEVRKTFDEKLVEIDLLKIENKKMEHELKIINNKNMESKQVEVKIENLSLKNIILEQKSDLLENQLLVAKKRFENNQAELTNVKDAVKSVKNTVNNQQVEIKTVKGEVKDLKTMLDYQEIDMATVNSEIMKKLKSYLDKGLNKQFEKIDKLSCRLTAAEKEVVSKCNTMNDKIDQNLLKDAQEEMEDLKSHIANIENILFCDISGGSKDVVLQWKLQNYQHYFDIGEITYSPVFFTEIKGYCFRFKVDWRGVNKKDFFIGLGVCRGRDYDTSQPFNIPYTLEVQDNNGNIASRKTALDRMKPFRETCFTIPPGEKCSQSACGFDNIVSMQKLPNCIVNDTLSIRCRITPP